MSLGAVAGTVPFDTTSYNFQLAGGGGGAAATLNGVPVEIFCDDFANNLDVPTTDTAYVTTLGAGENLSDTRFGGVGTTGWNSITLSDNNVTDQNFFNTSTGGGATAVARYDMVAYLDSLYNISQGGNTANNQIQQAIWTLMDPKAETVGLTDPSGVDPTSYLEKAVTWYNGIDGNQSALNTFMSQFQVIDSNTMTVANGFGTGGFQEQIVMTPIVTAPTPEPRGSAFVVLGILLGGFLVVRRNRVATHAALTL
jgi:hypothetical protein